MTCKIAQINEQNLEYYLSSLPKGFEESILEDDRTLIFGIESFGMAAGAIMVRLVAFKADIFWFYIEETHRGMGTGSKAILMLSKLLHRDYDIEEITMDIFAGSDEGLSHLFNAFPVERETLPQCVFETTLGQLLSSQQLSGKSKSSVALADVEHSKLMRFCNELIDRGEDLVPMPIYPDDYMKEQSAVFNENETPEGILLFARRGEGIEIPIMASFSMNSSAITDMMFFSIDKFRRFSEDTPVTVYIVEPRVKTMIKTLLSMNKDDNYGFMESERITLDLYFLDKTEEEAKQTVDVWKSFLQRQAS